ncbi:DUF6483 family protein [Paenibacillus lautus]|uniref:DUF6483 family protein n=1 Tax=Paenibacillus lautus TaxID=1401 RepID=UPI003D26EBF3
MRDIRFIFVPSVLSVVACPAVEIEPRMGGGPATGILAPDSLQFNRDPVGIWTRQDQNTLHLSWMQVGGGRMFRRDYLVRLIEDMTQMIAKVFSLKQERKHTEALWELDELFKRQFRLNSDLLRSLSAADIEQLFRSHGYLEADKLQSAVRLMEEEASLLLDLEREEEAVMLYTKVFQLYLKSALQGADLKLIGLTERIGMVRERLRSYALPETSMRDYYAYTEQQGMYAEAENTLYQLLDNGKMEYSEAVQFYQRLQLKLPEDLAKGGLPLEEVHEGMDELNRRFPHTAVNGDKSFT